MKSLLTALGSKRIVFHYQVSRYLVLVLGTVSLCLDVTMEFCLLAATELKVAWAMETGTAAQKLDL